MNTTLALLKQGFVSSCETTPEFKQFTRTFKSEFGTVNSFRNWAVPD